MLTLCLEAGSRARSEIEIDLKCIFGPGCNGAEGEAPLELQSFHQLPIIFSSVLDITKITECILAPGAKEEKEKSLAFCNMY